MRLHLPVERCKQTRYVRIRTARIRDDYRYGKPPDVQMKGFGMDQTRGTLLLLGAALVWGFAFAFQAQSSGHIGSLSFIAGKSFLAAAAMTVVLMVRGRLSRHADAAHQAAGDLTDHSTKAALIGGIACGVALVFADNLQQAGIVAYPEGAAASGRSGFLTATYVVMTALVMPFLGKKLHPLVLVAAFVCVLGMYLLCLAGGLSGVYFGDLLCLLCAVFYTVHLFVVDRFSRLDPVKLTLFQFLTSGIISAVAAVILEHPTPDQYLNMAVPLLYVGVISGGVGYTLQTMGQRHANPAVAAIVMSLESVFAALGGWLLLGEVLSTRELAGCALMFAAVIMAQVPPLLQARKQS